MKNFLRNIIFVSGLLISATTWASTPWAISKSYFAYGVNPADQKKLADICTQLKTDHMADIELLHRLHSDFKAVVSNSDTMMDAQARAQLIAEIKQVTERIIAASNPLWNKEVIPFQITWNLPRELFFDETEYKAIRQRLSEYGDLIKNGDKIKDLIRNVNPSFPTDLISFKDSKIKNSDFVKNASNPNKFGEISVLESYYINKPNQSIQKYFHMPWYKGDKYGLELTFEKNVTALEFCQFLPKTKFLIKIDYVFEAFGLAFQSNQDVFLEIKMESL